MNLSPHFTLAEMTRTGTGLPNNPDAAQIAYLRALCADVLEPWRKLTGPLSVNSGFRSLAVNDAIKGSMRSQHLKGQAADVVPVRMAPQDAWTILLDLIVKGLPVDQAIIYEASRPWIHLSYTPDRPARKAILVRDFAGCYVGWNEYLTTDSSLRLFR